MKINMIPRLATLALGWGLLQLAMTDAHGQALTGLSLGSEVRETLRGDRPGGGAEGPIGSGGIDILSQDPATVGGGQPGDPFTSLPDPNHSFDPSEGQDMSSEDPFHKKPDPDQSFDPSEGQDMGSEDPFHKKPDPNQSFDPSEGQDMESEDPFHKKPDPNQSFDPSEGQDMGSEDPFNQEPDPNQSFDPSEGQDMGSEDPFGDGPGGDQPVERKPPPPSNHGPNTTNIIMYILPSCPYCKKANETMTKEGVVFEERDVSKDPKWTAEMNAKVTGAGKTASGAVPTIDFKGQIIVGYNKSMLEQLCKGSK